MRLLRELSGKTRSGFSQMANLLGGRAAPMARCIQTGLSVGQPIDQEVVVHHLLEAYGDDQRCHGAESNCGQSGKQKKSKQKSKSREALERTQSQRFDVIKGAGSVARRATLQLSLFSMSTMTARPEPCQAKQLYGRLLYQSSEGVTTGGIYSWGPSLRC